MTASNRGAGWWPIVLLLAVGCSGSLPTTHYYLLDPPAAAAATADEEAIDIGVLPFDVDPPYDQDRIVYRVGEASPEIGFYEYHRWAAPLTRTLPAFVSGALSGLQGLASIEPATPGRGHDFYLHGRLATLLEIDLADRQKVVARLELSLRDAAGDELWSSSTRGEELVDTDSVERIVEAMRTALQGALETAYPSLYTRLVLIRQDPAPSD